MQKKMKYQVVSFYFCTIYIHICLINNNKLIYVNRSKSKCIKVAMNVVFMNQFLLVYSELWIMVAEPLQLFKTARKLFGMIGIHPPPPQSIRSNPFNIPNSLLLLFTFAMCIASFAFLLFKADNVQDFGFSFYTAITELYTILGFLPFIFKMSIVFEIMGQIERIMEKSKFVQTNSFLVS